MKIYFDPILRKFRVKDSGGSAGGTPTSVTYALLSSDISAGTATEGFYLITDATSSAIFGSKADLGILVQVYNDSNGNNKIRIEAEGVFLNPDYQGVGDYSGILNFNSQLGIWNSSLTPVVGDVVIWNGEHYVNLTGAVGTDPNGDAVNWEVKTKVAGGTTFGYIAESDFVFYDFVNDSINHRSDSRKNTIGANGITYFPWGNDSVLKNNIIGSCSLNGLNFRGSSLTELNISGRVSVDLTQACEGDIDCCEITGVNSLTLDLDSGKSMFNCKIENEEATIIDSSADYNNLTKKKGYSDFSTSFVITGLTTLNITSGFNYIGISYLTNGGGVSETINLFTNFPQNHPVRFYPAPNITALTFTHGTGANQPRCEGGISAVLDGSKGDWIEFTASGTVIKQTNIGTY